MFTKAEKRPLRDTKKYTLIKNGPQALEVRSKKTRQFWMIRLEGGWVVTYHKHHAKDDYHVQCRSVDARVASRKIEDHEKWVRRCRRTGRSYL